MKLAIMKLICLLALLGGVYMLGLVLDVDYAQQAHAFIMQHWPKQGGDALNLRMPGTIAGVLLVLVGLYGFLPKLPSRKGKTITFRGVNNEITLELKPIRKMLLKIMRRMPEVYAIEIDLRPDRDGKRAVIDARVVLQNCAAFGARQCLKVVEECIYSTARGLLGLEDCQVVMTLKGVHVDAAASGKQIREQLEMRRPAPEAGAQPEVKEEVKTESRPAAADAAKQAPAVAEPVQEAKEESAPKDAEDEEAQEEVPEAETTVTAASEAEERTVELPVVDAMHYEEPDPETSKTLHGIDLPPLAEEDMDLPPAPKINQDGEITTDEAADADMAMADSGGDEKTPDAVEVDILSPVPWKKEEMPEPVPDELSGDPEDVDVDTEEYHNT